MFTHFTPAQLEKFAQEKHPAKLIKVFWQTPFSGIQQIMAHCERKLSDSSLSLFVGMPICKILYIDYYRKKLRFNQSVVDNELAYLERLVYQRQQKITQKGAVAATALEIYQALREAGDNKPSYKNIYQSINNKMDKQENVSFDQIKPNKDSQNQFRVRQIQAAAIKLEGEMAENSDSDKKTKHRFLIQLASRLRESFSEKTVDLSEIIKSVVRDDSIDFSVVISGWFRHQTRDLLEKMLTKSGLMRLTRELQGGEQSNRVKDSHSINR